MAAAVVVQKSAGGKAPETGPIVTHLSPSV
jgi:hypothetical protein